VHILGVNFERTWFLVEHPQSFRYPCWVSNGSAVQVQGDLSCVQAVSIPNRSQLETANSQRKPSRSVTIPGEPPVSVDYCSLYPSLCQSVLHAIQQLYCSTPQPCSQYYSWNSSTCSCESTIPK
jgi:hypothetical protein